jgi:hypothetical protein
MSALPTSRSVAMTLAGDAISDRGGNCPAIKPVR